MMDQSSPTALAVLAEIGLKLRAAREASGLSLSDVAQQTRINQSFLAKIEAGEPNGLPGLAFVRGFIRNYIQVLDLHDPELEREIKGLSDEDSPGHDQKLSPPSMKDGNDGPSLPLGKLALVGISVAIIVILIFLLVSIFSGSDAETVSTVQTSQPPAAQMEQTESPMVEETPAEGQPPTENTETGAVGQAGNSGEVGGGTVGDTPSNEAAVRQTSALRLTIRGLEPTWLRISIDRAPAMDVQVQPAETVEWDANEEIRLTVGKSNAVAIYLNGEDIVLNEEPDRLVPSIVLNKLTLLRLEN